MDTLGLMNLLSYAVVRKPLFPILIKDQNTSMILSSLLIIISIYALYRIMKYYGR
jgi:hypothetical protein